MEYLLLLAKLNPVPLSIGLAVLVLLLALFFFQRRGTKGPRGVRRKQSSNTRPSVMVTPGASKTSAPVATAAPVVAPIPHSAGQAVRDHEQQARITRVAEQIKYVLSGEDYDRAVIASDDPATRQLVGAELVSALAGRDGTRRDRAREAFMSNGYFDDATRDLRVAESPAERAAGARRLSFVHDPAATPHLAAALEDSSPDVRRASVEALLDQRDPSATSALNALMKVEASNKVPRALIQQAIDACATSQTEVQPASNSAFASTHSSVAPKEFHPQPEREVIEI